MLTKSWIKNKKFYSKINSASINVDDDISNYDQVCEIFANENELDNFDFSFERKSNAQSSDSSLNNIPADEPEYNNKRNAPIFNGSCTSVENLICY